MYDVMSQVFDADNPDVLISFMLRQIEKIRYKYLDLFYF